MHLCALYKHLSVTCLCALGQAIRQVLRFAPARLFRSGSLVPKIVEVLFLGAESRALELHVLLA